MKSNILKRIPKQKPEVIVDSITEWKDFDVMIQLNKSHRTHPKGWASSKMTFGRPSSMVPPVRRKAAEGVLSTSKIPILDIIDDQACNEKLPYPTLSVTNPSGLPPVPSDRSYAPFGSTIIIEDDRPSVFDDGAAGKGRVHHNKQVVLSDEYNSLDCSSDNDEFVDNNKIMEYESDILPNKIITTNFDLPSDESENNDKIDTQKVCPGNHDYMTTSNSDDPVQDTDKNVISSPTIKIKEDEQLKNLVFKFCWKLIINYIYPSELSVFEMCKQNTTEKGPGISVFNFLPKKYRNPDLIQNRKSSNSNECSSEGYCNCEYHFVSQESFLWKVTIQKINKFIDTTKLMEHYNSENHLLLSINVDVESETTKYEIKLFCRSTFDELQI